MIALIIIKKKLIQILIIMNECNKIVITINDSTNYNKKKNILRKQISIYNTNINYNHYKNVNTFKYEQLQI